MERVPMESYEAARAGFRWAVPERFNFAVDVIDAIAARRPDHPALIACDAAGKEQVYSFAQVASLSGRLGAVLRAGGVGKGDRVIVMLPRIAAWQIAMVACLRIGAVPIPCVEMLTAKDVAYRLTDSGAVAAIAGAPNREKFADAPLALKLAVGADAKAKANGWLDFDAALAAETTVAEPAVVAADDPAIMFYTSGSTGEPKGVLHASRAIFAWRVSAWYWLTLGEGDVMWCTSDTGWSKAGTSILFGPWSCGSTVVFYDGPFDAKRRFALLQKHRVSVFCAPATELRRLLQEDIGGFDLSALRLTVSAGEVVNPALVERWREKTGVPLLDGYGQTETLMTVLNYPPMTVKPGAMGRPLPGTEVAVVDEAGRHAAPGEPGELAIRLPNPQVMLGYWQAPERTAAGRISLDGSEWILTGDRVLADAEGYLFHQGRMDDLINSAGYRIGPMEVENALASHPAVIESAVVPSPDEERGEVVKAFVVLRAGIEPDDALVQALQQHCKAATGPYKYPRRIAFVDDLPKTVSGKIRRNVLREREAATAGS